MFSDFRQAVIVLWLCRRTNCIANHAAWLRFLPGYLAWKKNNHEAMKARDDAKRAARVAKKALKDQGNS
jgi:hypothetical protein